MAVDPTCLPVVLKTPPNRQIDATVLTTVTNDVIKVWWVYLWTVLGLTKETIFWVSSLLGFGRWRFLTWCKRCPKNTEAERFPRHSYLSPNIPIQQKLVSAGPSAQRKAVWEAKQVRLPLSISHQSLSRLPYPISPLEFLLPLVITDLNGCVILLMSICWPKCSPCACPRCCCRCYQIVAVRGAKCSTKGQPVSPR